MPDPLDPRAWNRFGYVYGNPASLVDPSGHCIFGLATAVCVAAAGAALIGGGLNVTANALTRDNYNLLSTRALGDFTIGAGFGVAAYATGAILTSAGIAGALGISAEGAWAARIAFTSRVLALGELNALESYITAKSYGDSFGWHNARFAFGVGIAGGIVGEYIGSIGEGAIDELKAAYKLDNEVFGRRVGRRVMQAGGRLQAFERSAIQEMRYARKIGGTYTRNLANRLIRRRELLFANLRYIGQQSLAYPSRTENFIRIATFLTVATYGDTELYPVVLDLLSP